MSPAVTMHGIPLRFCQKCGRFQDLVRFDGLKRSCRQSLEAHNKRRREKSALSGRDKPWRDKTSPKQTRKALPNRPKAQPVQEANTFENEAMPSTLPDLNGCLSELDDLFGDPLHVPYDVSKAVPSCQTGWTMPDEAVRSELESQSEYSEHTLGVKFHGSSPKDLPKDMLPDIQRILSIDPMDAFFEGTVRPGCTHISLRIRVQEGEVADKLRSLGTEHLAKALSTTWRNETRALSKGMEVQWDGSCTHVGSGGSSSFTVRALPEISVCPAVVQSGMEVEFDVVMDDTDLHGMSVAAFCRQNGHYLSSMIVPENLDDFVEDWEVENSKSTYNIEDDVEEGVEDDVEGVNGGFEGGQMMMNQEDDDTSSCGAASPLSISAGVSITSDDTIERCAGLIQESRIRVRVIGLVPGSFEVELAIDNALTAPASLLALPTSDDVADARRLLRYVTRAQATAFARDAGMVVRHVFSPESLLPSDLPMIQRLAVKTCEWAMERRSSHLVRILQEALPAENACCGGVSESTHGPDMSGQIDGNLLSMAYPPDSKMLSTRLMETYELEAERAIVRELCTEISQLDVDEKSALVGANGWKNAILQVVAGATLVILCAW